MAKLLKQPKRPSRKTPAIILQDAFLPPSGLIRQVRALPPEQEGRIPAVALAAHVRVEDRRRALAAD